MSKKDHRDLRDLKEELEIHKKNLARLNLQKAEYGSLNVPLHISNQIENEEKEIKRIEKKIKVIEEEKQVKGFNDKTSFQLQIPGGAYRVFRLQNGREVEHELIKIEIKGDEMRVKSPHGWEGSGFLIEIDGEIKYSGKFKYSRRNTHNDRGTHNFNWKNNEFKGYVQFDNGCHPDDLIWRPEIPNEEREREMIAKYRLIKLQ